MHDVVRGFPVRREARTGFWDFAPTIGFILLPYIVLMAVTAIVTGGFPTWTASSAILYEASQAAAL